MVKEPLGKKISILSKLIKTRIDQNLQKYNITMEQSRFLMYLERNQTNKVYQKNLCDDFHSTKGSVSLILNNLEKRHLIERISGVDARHKEVKITSPGLDLLKQVKVELDMIDDLLLLNVSNHESEVLFTVIDRMINNVK